MQRPVDLVFISTSSIYGQRPNQYDRIVIPGRVWGGEGEVRYAYLGRTLGKGTYQFNAETMKALGRMLSQTRRWQRVNYVFGEGGSGEASGASRCSDPGVIGDGGNRAPVDHSRRSSRVGGVAGTCGLQFLGFWGVDFA